MKRPRVGRLTRLAPEVAIAVGATLGCFLLFLGLLGVTIRRGASVDELMRAPVAFDGWTRESARGPVEFAGREAESPIVAVLTGTRNDVRDKPASGLTWGSSRPGLPLEDRHAVQTFDRSRATIAFGSGDELVLGENALVVVKGRRRRSTGKKHASLLVLGGDLDVRLGPTPVDSVSFEVETAGDVRLRPMPGEGGETALRVSVDPSGGTTFSVFEGGAEVETPEATRAVGANQAVAIDSLGRATDPEPLPPRPILESPPSGTRLFYRERSPRVVFTWRPSDVDGYRIRLARDEAFEEIVHEERLAEPRFTFGNLQSGRYFWRVEAIGGATVGPAAVGGPLLVIRDVDPPPLEVQFPAGDVTSERVTLRGKTQPDADLYIDDIRIQTEPDGSFTHTLRLARGLNVVVIEAIDAAGNVTYRSETVTARY